ncbi:hypothetical protein BDK51DRAFT_29083 [Blyttiomyces helicus]|uniref:Uncharacterized protein n=1 Tax=Blyttiomyces helicus TaxID=388810 RepID=A0A4P9WL46_9FUNG|nr:hypothetical protein BDK51DRAFT_29083 [Blyttiomyces helicus]|eukprot:RKO92773.1 hypothetical protein BDK51DRAFT_29083 [Blyttiomyces helicus]
MVINDPLEIAAPDAGCGDAALELETQYIALVVSNAEPEVDIGSSLETDDSGAALELSGTNAAAAPTEHELEMQNLALVVRNAEPEVDIGSSPETDYTAATLELSGTNAAAAPAGNAALMSAKVEAAVNARLYAAGKAMVAQKSVANENPTAKMPKKRGHPTKRRKQAVAEGDEAKPVLKEVEGEDVSKKAKSDVVEAKLKRRGRSPRRTHHVVAEEAEAEPSGKEVEGEPKEAESDIAEKFRRSKAVVLPQVTKRRGRLPKKKEQAAAKEAEAETVTDEVEREPVDQEAESDIAEKAPKKRGRPAKSAADSAAGADSMPPTKRAKTQKSPSVEQDQESGPRRTANEDIVSKIPSIIPES